MSCLIDADKLKRRVQSVATEAWKMKLEAKVETILNQFLDYVEQSPTIDAVEVVVCKECKKANTEYCSLSYWDDDWGEWRVGYKGDKWFCADGERKGE